MSKKYEALNAAKAECEKLGVSYSVRKCRDHYQLMIENCKTIVTISNTRAINNVRTDIRRALRKEDATSS